MTKTRHTARLAALGITLSGCTGARTNASDGGEQGDDAPAAEQPAAQENDSDGDDNGTEDDARDDNDDDGDDRG